MLVGAFSVILKTGCRTDGALHSTSEDAVSEGAAFYKLDSPGARVPHAALARPRHAVAGLARDHGLAAVARALGRHLPRVTCSHM